MAQSLTEFSLKMYEMYSTMASTRLCVQWSLLMSSLVSTLFSVLEVVFRPEVDWRAEDAEGSSSLHSGEPRVDNRKCMSCSRLLWWSKIGGVYIRVTLYTRYGFTQLTGCGYVMLKDCLKLFSFLGSLWILKIYF